MVHVSLNRKGNKIVVKHMVDEEERVIEIKIPHKSKREADV